MKLSNDFDARCLRSRAPGIWPIRLGTTLAVLFILTGVLGICAAAISLFNQPTSLQALNDAPDVARLLLFACPVALLLGIFIWRRCRHRSRQTSGLSLAPHLMKRRD